MTRPPDDLESEQLKAQEVRKLLEGEPKSRKIRNLAAPVNAVVAARIQRSKLRGSVAAERNLRQRSAEFGRIR